MCNNKKSCDTHVQEGQESGACGTGEACWSGGHTGAAEEDREVSGEEHCHQIRTKETGSILEHPFSLVKCCHDSYSSPVW